MICTAVCELNVVHFYCSVCVCVGRSGGPPAAGVCDDGWTAVSRPPKSNIVDPSRLKLTKREQVDESAIQLGPGGRGMGMGWHRGSSGGGSKQPALATPTSLQDVDLRQPNRYVRSPLSTDVRNTMRCFCLLSSVVVGYLKMVDCLDQRSKLMPSVGSALTSFLSSSPYSHDIMNDGDDYYYQDFTAGCWCFCHFKARVCFVLPWTVESFPFILWCWRNKLK